MHWCIARLMDCWIVEMIDWWIDGLILLIDWSCRRTEAQWEDLIDKVFAHEDQNKNSLSTDRSFKHQMPRKVNNKWLIIISRTVLRKNWSGSVDRHIFADADPASQNIVDPTNPDLDPKHWFRNNQGIVFFKNNR